MISVQEANDIVLKEVRRSAVELVPLPKAHGRVLRESLVCDRDQPAFDKSTMDGIALSSVVFNRGIRSFRIHATVAAGMPAPKQKVKDGCFKIMTGAVVPGGCDVVIPVEYIQVNGDFAVVTGLTSVNSGWNVRYKGKDCPKGKVLLNFGSRLLPVHIAAAASIGKAVIKVSRLPKIAIISTGDELVDIRKKKIKPYQTRSSNAFAVASAVEAQQLGVTQIFHLKDDPKIIERELKKILNRSDILVLSGGVSMGDFDFIPQVLARLKVKRLFHKVGQKPGKPFWFGKTSDHKIIFALPGNPVSTLVCAYRYVLPFLKKSAGLALDVPQVFLEKDVHVKTDLAVFLPVECSPARDGRMTARILETGGSGDFASLTNSDGFIEITAGTKHVPQNSLVDLYPW